MISFRLILTMVAVAILVGGFAGADVFGKTTTFMATSGDWDVDDNWNLGAPNADGDIAIIDTGKTCNLDVTTVVLGQIEVKSTANLNVKAGGSLKLRADATSLINGTITLESSTSLLDCTASLSLTGSGKIVGQNDAATIQVADGTTLTNTTTIEGKLTIAGAGGTTFTNTGTVNANAAGTLWINTNQYDDSSAGLWKCTGAGATLQLDARVGGTLILELDGDFILTAGALDVDRPGFLTTGSLTWTGGRVDCGSPDSSGYTESAVFLDN